MNSTRSLGTNQALSLKKSLVKRPFHDYLVDYKSFFTWYASLNKKEKMLVDLIQDMARLYRWPFKAAPSHEWLGKQVGYTRQTVCLKLREFNKAGFIKWIYRHRKPSIYKAFKTMLTTVLLMVTGNAVSKPLYQGFRHHGIKQEFNNNSSNISLSKTPSGEPRKLQNGEFSEAEIAAHREKVKLRAEREAKERAERTKQQEESSRNATTLQEAAAKNPEILKYLARFNIRL